MGNSDSKDNLEKLDSQETANRLRTLAERCKVQEECWNMVENEGLLKELIGIAERSSKRGGNLDLVLDLLTLLGKNCIIHYTIETLFVDFNEFYKQAEYKKHTEFFHKKMEEAGGYKVLEKLLLSCGQSMEKKEEKEKVAVALACCSLCRDKIDSSSVAEPLVSTIIASLEDCKMDESLRIYNLMCASYSCFLIVSAIKVLFKGIGIDRMIPLFMKFLNHKDPCILSKNITLFREVFMGLEFVPISNTMLEALMKLVPPLLSNVTDLLTCGKGLIPLSEVAPVPVTVPEPLSSPLCYASATNRDTRVSSLGLCLNAIECLLELTNHLDSPQLAVVAAAMADRKIWDVALIAFELFDVLHAQMHHSDGDGQRARERYKVHVVGLLITKILGFIVELMEKYTPVTPAFEGYMNMAGVLVVRQADIIRAGAAKPLAKTEIIASPEDLMDELRRLYLTNVAYVAKYLFLVSHYGSKHPEPATGKNSVRGRMDNGMTVFPLIMNVLGEGLDYPDDEGVVAMCRQARTFASLAVCLLHRGTWPQEKPFEAMLQVAWEAKEEKPSLQWIWNEMKEEK